MDVFRVKLPSWQPTFLVAPNWFLVPCLSRILYVRAVRIQLKILEHTPIRLMIQNWFGSSGRVVLGIGVPVPVCQSG